MPKSGGRMRIIEHRAQAVDLSRTETGLIRLRIGSCAKPEPEYHMDLYPGDARVLAYSLLAAALREPRGQDNNSFWPEEYYAEGSFPSDQLQESRKKASP